MLVGAVALQIMRGGSPQGETWKGPVFAANALAVATMSFSSPTLTLLLSHIPFQRTKDAFLWDMSYLAFLTSTIAHVHTCAVYICRFAQSRV